MAWQIDLTETVSRQLAKFDKQAAKRIVTFLRERVAPLDDPRSTGKVLTGLLGCFWRCRVGDYHIICDIQDNTLCVLVVEIGNRRKVYR